MTQEESGEHLEQTVQLAETGKSDAKNEIRQYIPNISEYKVNTTRDGDRLGIAELLSASFVQIDKMKDDGVMAALLACGMPIDNIEAGLSMPHGSINSWAAVDNENSKWLTKAINLQLTADTLRIKKEILNYTRDDRDEIKRMELQLKLINEIDRSMVGKVADGGDDNRPQVLIAVNPIVPVAVSST